MEQPAFNFCMILRGIKYIPALTFLRLPNRISKLLKNGVSELKAEHAWQTHAEIMEN